MFNKPGNIPIWGSVLLRNINTSLHYKQVFYYFLKIGFTAS